MNSYPNQVTVLLVEDNDIDAEAISRGFRKYKIANPIQRAVDGIEALEILRAKKIPRPFLILLDINLPKMNGIEFLRELRSDKELHTSIVFVLTTSNENTDKVRAYDRNVAGYLLKTNVGEDFVNLVGMLEHYWRFVEFPPA